MTFVAELADRAWSVATGPIPESVYRATAAHLTDTVGAVLAGKATLGRPVQRLLDIQGLAPGPRRTAFTAGVYAGGWEVAGIHRAAVLCPGCVVLPATLAALSRRRTARWDQVLRAYLAGYEVALAAALAIGGDRLIAAGWWPTALLGPLGAAAAASVLLEHSPADTASAIALAAQQAGGLVAGSSASAEGRYLLSGLAAERAISAVLAAEAGWRGPLDILDDPRSPLGRTQAAPAGYQLPGTSLKAHAGAKHVQAALDALTELRGAGLVAGDVLSMTCALPAPLVGPVDRPPPFGSALNALASAQFMLAVTAQHGRCSPREYRPELLDDPELTALAGRIRLVAADDLTAAYPADWPARVEVSTSGGTLRAQRRQARGDPGHELTGPELVAKFTTLAARSIGEQRARELAGELRDPVHEAMVAPLVDRVLPLLDEADRYQEA